MKKFIGIVLVLCSLALPLAGCKEAISTVTCNTMSELEDIPGQILSTPESAETEPEYNYIHKLVVPYQKAYNVNCDVAQKVASAVW